MNTKELKREIEHHKELLKYSERALINDENFRTQTNRLKDQLTLLEQGLASLRLEKLAKSKSHVTKSKKVGNA